jgi:hypothetical protein
MSQPSIVWKPGDYQDFTLGSNTQNLKLEKSQPQGLIREMVLTLYSTSFALGGGSAVTDGEKRVLRSLTVRTDKHGVLYQNIPGFMLYDVMTLLFQKSPSLGAVGASGFNCRFPIPFGFLGNLRHPAARLNDMSLWAIATKPIVEGVVGTLTDLVSGGSPSAAMRARLLYEYEPNPNPLPEDPKAADPIAGSGDRPKYQIEMYSGTFDSLNATGRSEKLLSVGAGRVPLYIVLFELDTADAKVSNILSGRNAKIELRHGSDYILEDTPVADWDEHMADFLGLSSLGTGIHLIPFVKDGTILDSIVLDAVKEFKLSIADPNSVSSRKLAFVCVNAVPIRDAAQPENQKA